jgi:hypothetical protein
MSDSANIALDRRLYDSKADPAVTKEIMAPHIVWDITPGFPGGGVYPDYDSMPNDFFGSVGPPFDSLSGPPRAALRGRRQPRLHARELPRRDEGEEEEERDAVALHPPVARPRWAEAFRRTGNALKEDVQAGTLERGLRWVLAYHVIFHWNRVGLSLGAQSALVLAARTAILDPPADPAETP